MAQPSALGLHSLWACLVTVIASLSQPLSELLRAPHSILALSTPKHPQRLEVSPVPQLVD